jgi:hypothetical protein
MPYRLRGNTVEVSRSKGWTPLKTHRSKEMAQKHLAALQANVKHTTPKKRR